MSLFGDDSGQGGNDPEAEGQVQLQNDPGNQPPQQEENYSPFAQKFLSELPEDQRGVVGPHLKKWDAGFTRYAQGVQGELKKYRELGDHQELVMARQLLQQLQDDPAYIARVLVEQGYYTPETPGTPQQQQSPNGFQQQQASNGEQDPYAPRFQKLEQENQRYERALGAVAQYIQQERAAKEQEAADRQLDEFIGTFNQRYPGVPEKFVLTMLNSGVLDPAEIAGEWQGIVQNHINRGAAGKPPPNVMGAGSQPPVANNTADYTDEQRKQALKNAIFGG